MAGTMMTETGETRAGGCLCGAVRFEARGAPLWVAHCHCTSCRRTTASAFTTYAGYRPGDVVFTSGRPKKHRSSPVFPMKFKRCDSTKELIL